MTTLRTATCACGSLRVTCEGEPVRVSMCHCLACQQRTGSVFGVQARFRPERIRSVEGACSEYVRVGDEGGRVRFRFCPRCGSTVYWTIDASPDLVAVAVGAFADPGFAAPTRSVYGVRRHPWVVLPGGPDVEHIG